MMPFADEEILSRSASDGRTTGSGVIAQPPSATTWWFNFLPATWCCLSSGATPIYYDVLRITSIGRQAVGREPFRDYTVITRPVDKRENYIKRCVAIAGDSLKIVGGVDTNDEPYSVEASSTCIQMTRRRCRNTRSTSLRHHRVSGGNGSNYYMLLDDERAEELRRMGNVLAVERFIYEEPNREVYPHDLTLG